MKSPRILLALLCLLAAFVLAACGDDSDSDAAAGQEKSSAETEGIYVDVDHLKYQVQASKQLNALQTIDQDYLEGVAEADRQLAADEEWFLVLLRVENDDKDRDPIQTADTFQIVDSQGNVFRPVALDETNRFAYRPTTLAGGHVYPNPESTAGERPPYGAELLFKIKTSSLDNRPLRLVIESAISDQKAHINLDV
jgi:hypothetical protein